MRKITLIMAHASDSAIGHNGGLPWPHHSEDMRRFRKATMGGAVIMGRVTWESLPGALPYRHNIVVTSKPDKIDKNQAEAVSTIDAALAAAGDSPIFFIGGQTLYSQCLVHVNHYLLTEIHGRWPADSYFRVPFLESKKLVNEEHWEHPTDANMNCTFREYRNV